MEAERMLADCTKCENDKSVYLKKFNTMFRGVTKASYVHAKIW